MDEQTNDQVQAVCQDVEGLEDQLKKILELLTTGRGKNVAGTSSQVEVDLNQVLEDMSAYLPGFTPQRSSSPRMVDRTYPTSFPMPNPNTTTQQAVYVSDPYLLQLLKVVHRWKDLANSFLKQYKYNIDMAPDRLDLQRMEKKNVENFKEYAQRWRDLATQVQPPLTDKELIAMFINTIRAPYYDIMVGSASTNFSDVITIEERIEFGVKNGKIIDSSSERRRMMTSKKKWEKYTS
ncbi:Gag-pro-like protein [Cucumis melo var. makuwa]|uniref:Gag-pro-like protein n=1 Tax=Cucumis melo var. makuwa TaxID=1194695 RepID=A0A5D3BSD2_CUCMM|nr:Gag-pro-like protein [Cucumis melo var. makuwa]TYK02651.1 Gag-pro-like protein [Cucumis melo var. makuwa]